MTDLAAGHARGFISWTLKLAATALLMLYLWVVWQQPELRAVLTAELDLLGPGGSALLITSFLIGVALYARTLHRCLALLHPADRAAPPASVWYMFLLPLNFIEDFFIISNVSRSLQAGRRRSPSLGFLNSSGAGLGYGWCAAQLLCFLPHVAGKVATVVALLLWAAHWHLIARVNRVLTEPTLPPHVETS